MQDLPQLFTGMNFVTTMLENGVQLCMTDSRHLLRWKTILLVEILSNQKTLDVMVSLFSFVGVVSDVNLLAISASLPLPNLQ